jgi:hypothetical protein
MAKTTAHFTISREDLVRTKTGNCGESMKKLLAGLSLAVLVVLAMPMSASAGQYDPYFTVSSTSYSGQPSKFVVNVVNNLQGTAPVVKVTNAPGLNGTPLSCSAGDTVDGLGNYRCTLSGTKRLSPGSLKVTAYSAGSGKKSATVTRTASVSSRFAVTSSTSPTEGQGFSVRGRHDDIAGLDDVTVRARVTSGGTVVGGQSSVACNASAGSFSCSLRSVVGAGSTYSVRVTETLDSGYSRSSTRSVTVASTAAPATPTFSGPNVYVVTEQPTSISGDSSRSGLRIQVLVDPSGTRNWSSPTTSCTSGSGGFWSCPLAGNLPAGNHTFEARAVDPEDPSKISGVAVRRTTLTKQAEPTPSATPTPTPTPAEEPTAEPTAEAVPEPEVQVPTTPVRNLDLSFDGLSTPFSQLLLLLVLALAVVTLARPGPLSLVLGGNSVPFAEPEDELAGRELALRRGIGIGDNSPTWRAVGHEATDFWSRTMPGLLSRHSPFLARLSADGVDLRAIFGTLWWLFPLSAGALALAAGGQTGADGVPTAALIIAIMAISCFDAVAGFVATLLFGLVTIGDVLTDKNSALVVLALGFLWTSLPLVATAIRPFRRPGVASLKYGWDRVADLVITAALCGLIARLLASTMDVFAGTGTDLPADANTVGVIAFVCIAARVLLANAVDVWWPERLRNTEIQEDLPAPSPWAILGGIVVRAAVFAFIGHAFVGNCWQWWLAVLLFVLPDLLVMARDWFDLQWQVRLPLPVGVTEIFILVVTCTVLIALVVASADSQLEALRYGLVAAALAPAVLASAQAFEDDSKRQTGSTWDRQLAGAGILLTTVVLALNGWGF